MRKQHYISLIFSLSFVGILSMPAFCTLLDINPKDVYLIQENRKLSEKPDITTTSLYNISKQWDNYFNDHLAYRNHFLGIYIYIWEKILRSPVNQYVTGRHGELFMNHAAPIVDAALDIIPKTDEEMDLVRLGAAGTAAYFSLSNIPYYLFLIPDKTTLYPELMPFYASFTEHKGWYPSLQKTLEDAHINFYSLYEYFLQSKHKISLYNKIYDVEHWNGNGIDLAYKKISNILSQTNIIFSPLIGQEYYTLYNKEVTASVFGIETVPFIKINNIDEIKDITYQLPINNISPYYTRLYENPNKQKGTLWLLTDSYFNATHGLELCTPFIHNVHFLLQTHYQETSLLWFDKILNKYKPSAVVETFVERAGLLAHRSSQDSRLRILGDIWLNTPGYLLDAALVESQAQPVNATKLLNDQTCILNAVSDDPLLLLPPITTDSYGRAVVMANLNSPSDTVAQLFYDEKGHFNAQQSVACPIKRGDNLIHLSIKTKPNSTVFLRFDPGMVAGSYIFSSIFEAECLKEKISHGL